MKLLVLFRTFHGFVRDLFHRPPTRLPYSCRERIDHCIHPVDIKDHSTDDIVAFIDDPANGCKGRWSFGYTVRLYFEDPHTAFLVKMRLG